MERCETCEHWEPAYIGQKAGLCRRLEATRARFSTYLGDDANGSFLVDAPLAEDIRLLSLEPLFTKPTFGCVHHEPREEAKT